MESQGWSLICTSHPEVLGQLEVFMCVVTIKPHWITPISITDFT